MPIIEIRGPCCANCRQLTLTEQALAELGRPEQVEKATDHAQIASYGVMSTPALAVGEQVLLAGRMPGLSSLKAALAEWLPTAA